MQSQPRHEVLEGERSCVVHPRDKRVRLVGVRGEPSAIDGEKSVGGREGRALVPIKTAPGGAPLI
jgi:hypothetical protein